MKNKKNTERDIVKFCIAIIFLLLSTIAGALWIVDILLAKSVNQAILPTIMAIISLVSVVCLTLYLTGIKERREK